MESLTGEHGVISHQETSLWSSGICIVLMASKNFSADFSLCLESLVKVLSSLIKY